MILKGWGKRIPEKVIEWFSVRVDKRILYTGICQITSDQHFPYFPQYLQFSTYSPFSNIFSSFSFWYLNLTLLKFFKNSFFFSFLINIFQTSSFFQPLKSFSIIIWICIHLAVDSPPPFLKKDNHTWLL